MAHRQELFEELAAVTSTASGQNWVDVLNAAGVPTTLIQSIDQVVANEQVAAIGALPYVPHPRIDDFRVVNLPIQIDGEYAAVRRVPPLLGEHNDEVLGQQRDTSTADQTVKEDA